MSQKCDAPHRESASLCLRHSRHSLEGNMAFQGKAPLITEQFEVLLADAVRRVKTEEDPLVLNEYKKLFKKNVPFFLRSYVAAYLAKGFILGEITIPPKNKKSASHGSGGRSNKNSRKGEKPTSFEKNKGDRPEKGQKKEQLPAKPNPPTPRISIEEDKAASVFISVGRNRGVYARDLIGLVSQRALIARERIGDIRILDNYSFVQVYAEDAENIISLLDGTDYRNRKLAVSRAHKKEEGESIEQNRFSTNDQTVSDYPTKDTEMTSTGTQDSPMESKD